MPRYLIERTVPGAGKMTAAELQALSAKSNAVVAGLGEPYTWVISYVAGDKIYCLHDAENADAVYRHAREGGFPADKVTEVATAIGPATANGAH
jgi:hypothetical protein